jgi:hypothetical protein
MRLIATTTCLLLACGSTTAPGPTTEAPIGNRVAPAPTDPPDGAAPAATGVSLTSVSPEQGDVNGGTYVVVKGRGFTTEVRDAKIYFGATGNDHPVPERCRADRAGARRHARRRRRRARRARARRRARPAASVSVRRDDALTMS